MTGAPQLCPEILLTFGLSNKNMQTVLPLYLFVDTTSIVLRVSYHYVPNDKYRLYYVLICKLSLYLGSRVVLLNDYINSFLFLLRVRMFQRAEGGAVLLLLDTYLSLIHI